ncbi:MAG: transcription antitermination factor NusB [Actinomycetota bacterium]
MRARRTARRLALDVLYEAEIRDLLPLEAWDERGENGWVVQALGEEEGRMDDAEPAPEVIAYAHALVTGVQEHQADIDVLIVRYADRWAIERMPVVDRSLVRMALFELLWCPDIPIAVAINEAVELAKSLSTEDSGRFINGLLGRIVDKERAEQT